MKTINVVAAVIKKDNKILATQRGYGEFKGLWEFPGGKIEKDETPEEALVREIKEELSAQIKINNYITTVEYDYPEFHLSMQCFLCEFVDEEFSLNEHMDKKWLDISNIDSVAWLPADIEIIRKISK